MKNTAHEIKRKLGMLKLSKKLGNVSQEALDIAVILFSELLDFVLSYID